MAKSIRDGGWALSVGGELVLWFASSLRFLLPRSVALHAAVVKLSAWGGD